MRHDIESCDQGGEDQDKTWLDGPVARVKGKSEALERWTMTHGKIAWASYMNSKELNFHIFVELSSITKKGGD